MAFITPIPISSFGRGLMIGSSKQLLLLLWFNNYVAANQNLMVGVVCHFS